MNLWMNLKKTQKTRPRKSLPLLPLRKLLQKLPKLLQMIPRMTLTSLPLTRLRLILPSLPKMKLRQIPVLLLMTESKTVKALLPQMRHRLNPQLLLPAEPKILPQVRHPSNRVSPANRKILPRVKLLPSLIKLQKAQHSLTVPAPATRRSGKRNTSPSPILQEASIRRKLSKPFR